MIESFKDILQPCLQHRFQILFGVSNVELPNLTKQVTSFNYDMVSKTGRVVIELPLVGNGIESSLEYFNMSPISSIVIEYLDGSATPGHSVHFSAVHSTSCIVSHNYASSTVVTINLEFSYHKCTTTKTDDSGKETNIPD